MKNELDPNVRPHTTHFACDERLAAYGGKTIGCCCTGHICQVNPQVIPQDVAIEVADTRLINHALVYAKNAHAGQERDGGGDFMTHPYKTYLVLKQLTDDEALLCAALLHDTIEDTHVTYDDLKATFGQEIADLVNEVTHEGKPDSKGYYFPRLHSKRGTMLKFADRLANISEMDAWDEKRQAHYLRKSRFWHDSPND